jgi:O-antigen ligase
VANIGYLPRQDFAAQRASPADMLIRSVLIAAVFLSLWISFRPFAPLDEPIEVTDAGNLINQLGYTTLFALLLAWNLAHQPQRLLLLVRPILIATLFWFALSVATSWDPSVSARRLAFACVTIGIAGMVLLVPKSPRHFADVLAVVVLIVLAACYLGVALMPTLSIHQASDVLEPELAGDWRGVFGHKNEASAAMVLFVFIGIFVARVRNVGLGAIIVMLALPFLYFTHSKTAMAALPLTLIVSMMMARATKPRNGLAVALGLLIALNLLSVGSVYISPIRAVTEAIMPDATFTGRTEIWQFAIDHVLQRPITGYGFATFWGTEQVVYGMSGATWANTASHAHNGFVDLALTIGIPGSALVTLWLFVLPFVDYYRAPRTPDTAALRMLFLQICVYAAFESCFETVFTQLGAMWMILIAAAFGLRLLATLRVAR